MGMQKDSDTDYDDANPYAPSPCGPGGSTVQVNQNEAEIIEASYEAMGIQAVGWQADDSHITPAFRGQAL